MRKKQFYFIEPSKVGTQHISLIEGYLVSLSSSSMIKKDYVLNLGASKRTLETLPEDLVSKFVTKSIPVMNPEKRRLIVKTFVEFFTVLRYMSTLRSGDVLFVTCVLPTTLWLLEMVNRLLKKKGVYIVLHGELEGLIKNKSQSVLSIGYWAARWFRIRQPESYIDLVVLDNFIKETLLDNFPEKLNDKNVHVIHHPVSPEVLSISDNEEKFSVCFIGYRTKFKGFNIFSRLADECPDITFLAIGGGVVEDVSTGSVKPLKSKDDFISEISKCSVTLFPYTSGYYCSLSASALDALAAGIYMIALEQPFFRSLERYFGSDMVAVCTSVEELRAQLLLAASEITNSDKKAKIERVLNSKYSLKAVQKSFETLVYDSVL